MASREMRRRPGRTGTSEASDTPQVRLATGRADAGETGTAARPVHDADFVDEPWEVLGASFVDDDGAGDLLDDDDDDVYEDMGLATPHATPSGRLARCPSLVPARSFREDAALMASSLSRWEWGRSVAALGDAGVNLVSGTLAVTTQGLEDLHTLLCEPAGEARAGKPRSLLDQARVFFAHHPTLHLFLHLALSLTVIFSLMFAVAYATAALLFGVVLKHVLLLSLGALTVFFASDVLRAVPPPTSGRERVRARVRGTMEE